jgi:hypothetical protein
MPGSRSFDSNVSPHYLTAAWLQIRKIAANGGFTQAAASPSLAAADITGGLHPAKQPRGAERLRWRHMASLLFHA